MGGICSLIFLQARNEEKINYFFVFPLNRSKTNLPIFEGLKKNLKIFLFSNFYFC